MASKDYDSLLKQNEKPFHRGSSGNFSDKTKEEGLEPFQGVGYDGAFDRLPVLDLNDRSPTIALPKIGLRLTHCPAHHNYSPFPLVSFSHLRTPSKLMQFFQAMKYLHCEDIYLLEEDDETHFLLRPDRFTVRLTGWEHLDTQSDAKKPKRRKERMVQTITWNRPGKNSSEEG